MLPRPDGHEFEVLQKVNKAVDTGALLGLIAAGGTAGVYENGGMRRDEAKDGGSEV